MFLKRNLSEEDAFYPPPVEVSAPRWATHNSVVAVDGLGADEVAALNALHRMKRDDESGIRATSDSVCSCRHRRFPRE